MQDVIKFAVFFLRVSLSQNRVLTIKLFITLREGLKKYLLIESFSTDLGKPSEKKPAKGWVGGKLKT